MAEPLAIATRTFDQLQAQVAEAYNVQATLQARAYFTEQKITDLFHEISKETKSLEAMVEELVG
jgi:hypothetical protein